MQTFYLTEEEADAQVKKINATFPTDFCPLSGKTCKINCVCFTRAYSYFVAPTYIVTGFYCSNRMFFSTNT